MALTKFINAFGDKMLAKALRKETAGACVAEHGQICGGTYLSGNSYCSYHRIYDEYCYYTYNCYGNCGEYGLYCYYSHTGIVC